MKTLKSVCLVTEDVRKLREFYTTVLEVTSDGDDSFVMISTTGINLSISSTKILEEMAPGLRIESPAGNCFLEFEVGDVDREYERLKTLNVEVIKPPTTQPWGLRSVWFCDPQGNRVNFYAHVARSEAQDTNL